MHKERIIDGIEKVFEGYAKDEELKEALRASQVEFNLFKNYSSEKYVLCADGTIQRCGSGCTNVLSSPKQAAENYFNYFRFRCKPPATITKAKAMLEADLGARVEVLKRGYAWNFNQECDRQAESRYVRHPDV